MASKRGKSKGIPSDNELDKQLEAWRKVAEAKMTTALVLRMDELSPTVMNSKARKQALASALNEWASHLMGKVAEEIAANRIGYEGRKVVIRSDLPAMRTSNRMDYLGEGLQLKPKYLERKELKKNLAPPHYFKFSGDLERAIPGANVRLFRAEDVQVTRAYESEDFHPIPGQPGKFRAQKVVRNALGLYATKLELSTGWVVEVTSDPIFRIGLRKTWDRHTPPEFAIKRMFPGDEDTQAKLLGYGKPHRPYRPLFEDYMGWFITELLPATIRETYQKPRR